MGRLCHITLVRYCQRLGRIKVPAWPLPRDPTLQAVAADRARRCSEEKEQEQPMQTSRALPDPDPCSPWLAVAPPMVSPTSLAALRACVYLGMAAGIWLRLHAEQSVQPLR